MAARSKSPTKSSTPPLSEAARHVVTPAGIVSTGWPRVAAVLAALGIVFDLWQIGAAKLILAKREDGSYASDTVVLSIPRQVGKTFLLGAIVFALCLINPGMTVIWTAHHTRTSDETFGSMRSLAARPRVKKHIARVRAANGQQGIHFVNGSRILFGAREMGFGRGFSGVDVVMFDEAQILTESAVDDILATTNQASTGNPLILMAGTPPRPKDPGEVFRNRRAEAIDAGSGVGDTLYIEFSADDDADPTDRKQWAKANPSYPHRTPAKAIQRLLKHLGLASFRREALGVWDAISKASPLLTADEWDANLAQPPMRGPVAYGVRFSVDGSKMALAVAVECEDSSAFAEVLDYGSTSMGIAGVAAWLTERANDADSIVIDGKSNAGLLTEALRDAGIPARRIKRPTADDVVTASGRLVELVRMGRLKHAGQPGLRLAATNAVKRDIGNLGGWGFAAPSSDEIYVPALEAVALAVSGLRDKPTAAPNQDSHDTGRGSRTSGRRAVVM